jgi:hypothetical protein
MTMTLETQFALVAKKQEETFEREVIAGSTYLKLLNEHFGPGSDIYCQTEHLDDEWDPAQRKLWRYLLTNDHLSYIHLTELLKECGTGNAVWNITRHCLWMAYFCFCETEEEVDEVLEKVEECEHCRDTAITYVMQYVLFSQPMEVEIVATIVHSGGMREFCQMMWDVLEAKGQGFYHAELPKSSLHGANRVKP